MSDLLKTFKKVATFVCAFIGSFTFSRKFVITSPIFNTLFSSLIAIVVYKQVFRYRGHRRRLSLFSQSMVNNFDTQCNVPSTIINGWLYFDFIPPVSTTLALIQQHLMQFYRFTSYVTTDHDGYLVWQPLALVEDDFHKSIKLVSQYQTNNVHPNGPRFDLKKKIFVHFAQSDAEMHDIATKISNSPFQHQLRGDSCSPPWEFHHIVNVGFAQSSSVNGSDYDVSLLPPENISPPLPNSQTAPSPYHTTKLTEKQRGESYTSRTTGALPQQTRLATTSSHHIVVMRLDHTMGDGLALLNCFGKLFENEEGVSVSDQLLDTISGSCSPSPSTPSTTPSTTRKKNHSKTSLLQQIPTVLSSVFSTLALAASQHDTSSTYNQIPFVSKQTHAKAPLLPLYTNTREVVVIPTISLPFVKKLKDTAGVTLNDVMVCITAGGMRRLALYNESNQLYTNSVTTIDKKSNATNNDFAHPIFTPQLEKYQKDSQSASSQKSDIVCRGLLPIAFPRPRDDLCTPDRAMTNQFTFLSMPFHINIIDPIQRLNAIKVTTNNLKTSPDAIVSYSITNIGTRCLPPAIAQNTAAQLFSRHSMVFSNVPGPQGAILYRQPDGVAKEKDSKRHKLVGLQMVYPNLITQCGILSLNNCIFMNLTLDCIEMNNAHLLGGFIHEELKALAVALKVDWMDPFQ